MPGCRGGDGVAPVFRFGVDDVTLADIAGYFVLIAVLGAGWILLSPSGDE